MKGNTPLSIKKCGIIAAEFGVCVHNVVAIAINLGILFQNEA
jgi:hypothetical protein